MGCKKEIFSSRYDKKLLSIFVTTLLLLASFVGMYSVFVPLARAQPAGSIVVDADGEGNYTRIQAAIDNASSGDTILINESIYNENLVVTESITLEANSGHSPVINGNGGMGINVTADSVSLRNLTITNCSFMSVLSWNADHGNISHCNISDNDGSGLVLLNSSGWNISNNRIFNTAILENPLPPGMALILINTSSNCIYENTISNNSVAAVLMNATQEEIHHNDMSNSDQGLILSASTNNNISNNNFVNDGLQFSIPPSTTDKKEYYIHTIQNNTVNDQPLRYYKNSAGISLDGNSTGQLILANCTNFSIKNIAIDSNTPVGFVSSFTDNSLFYNCSVSSCVHGMSFSSSSGNNITSNRIYNNSRHGLMLAHSDSNNVSSNNIFNNGYSGIYIFSSDNNILFSNIVQNNDDGVKLTSSNNNLIYNNYFDNPNNAWDNGTNRWNVSKTAGTNIVNGTYRGGNYWNDYTGSDNDGDGIGDQPYNISGGDNQDLNPLMRKQYNITGTIYYNGTVDGTISVIALDNLSDPQPVAYDNLSDVGDYRLAVTNGTYYVAAIVNMNLDEQPPGDLIGLAINKTLEQNETPDPIEVNGSDYPDVDITLERISGNVSGGLTKIRGNITDADNSSNFLGNVTIEIMKHDQSFENFTITNETGQYSFNLSSPEAGPGMYQLMAMRDGYVSYINPVEIQETGTHWIDIELTQFFEEPSYIRGHIESSDINASLSGAEIVLLDTNTTHMMENEGGGFEYTSNETGYYNIPVNYSSTFNLIAFKDGYYAKLNSSTVQEGNTTSWCNFSLAPAEPDHQTLDAEFTDLDDVSVTVNRTINAGSTMLRFALDFMPQIGGNNNQIVSQSEVEGFLSMIGESGPTVNVTLEGGMDEGEGGPDFLQIPVNLLLDGSNLDSFVPGTYDITLENVVNTSINSNATIYYNATFNLTLDGTLRNELLHNFTFSSKYANLINTTMNVSFTDFYTVNQTTGNTNVSIHHNSNWVVIQPGDGPLDELAYAWVTLDLNTSTVSLPLVETPEWHVTDQWEYNKKLNGQQYDIALSVGGKPLREHDRYEYMVRDENGSYLCYKMRKENRSGQTSDMLHATLSNIDWIHLNEDYEGIAYIVNDLDFPLYEGKQWETVSWWGEPVTANIVNMSTTKETEDGTFTDTILVNYTNTTDAVVGQEWYNPSVKCYVNRTQYDDEGSIAEVLDLKSYQHAPYIQSTGQPYAYDEDDEKIDAIKINVTLNTSGLNESGDFRLEGSLHKETDEPGPPMEITWIDKELENLNGSTNTTNVTLSYRGSLIRSKEINGPYTGWLEFKKMDQWEAIDYTSFETVAYNYTNFTSPAVTVSNLSDFGNDTNNNTLYDYLTLNVTLNVTQSGNYTVHGGLEYVEQHIHWDEWWWITGTDIEPRTLTQGTEETIQLNFAGRDIYDKAFSGTGYYRYHLEVMNADTWQRVYEKSGSLAHSYNYSMFETPSIYFNKTYMTQYGQHDYINGSDLEINTSILVEEDTLPGGNGSYNIHGGIHYGNLSDPNAEGEFIVGGGKDIKLYEGENHVQLPFDASDIYEQLQEDGKQGNVTFKVHLGFSEKSGDWHGRELDHTTYFTTKSMDDFPEPGIVLNITNSEITEDGNQLVVNANVTLNDANYIGDYEIHGGVHWIDNSSGEQDWRYITGNGTQRPFSSTGNYTVQLNFSGMKIAASGHDGPYMISMEMESTPDWIEVASDEYRTEAYAIAGNFTEPSVAIDEAGITESMNGTDYFTITVPINVTEPGDYEIHGGIHWVDYSHGWEDWRFITGTGDEHYLSSPYQNITLNFDQGSIKKALENNEYCGKLMLHIDIENATNWNQIAETDYETSQPYCAGNFSSSALSIVNHSFSLSQNGDLILNVTVDATQNCSYSVNGGINWIDYSHGWEDWVFITGVHENNENFETGTNYKEYTFDGGEIYNSMQDGPYKVWFGIENESRDPPKIVAESEFDANYTYTDFAEAAPDVRIIKENMSAGTVDYMNNTQSGTFLAVNVSINKSTAGTENYWLEGGLEYVDESNNTWKFITGTGKEISLSQGPTIKPLNFNAGDIYSSGYDGPYTVWIALRNMTTWTDEDHYEYTTQPYTAGELPAPPISFAMENGDPSFSYINESFLTINATINVTNSDFAGEYDIHGGVEFWNGHSWQHITDAGTQVELEENKINVVPLNYNAGEINQSLPDGYNHNLTVFMGINEMGDWNEISRCEHETQAFDKSDFPGPSVTMEADSYYINESYFTANLTVNVSNGNQGQYDIHGGVHWIDTSHGWDEWRFITGAGHEFFLQNGTNSISLNFNGGEIHQALQENGPSKLSCYIEIEEIGTWQEITYAEFETTETYNASDFPGPGVIINLTGDYCNQSGQFLTVNATITATEEYQNTSLDLHGGIHWTEGWEWRFITGIGRQINLTNDETNISINFNGRAIRSSEHNGPYEVWIGINEPETWKDITHKERTTEKDYNYTRFALPDVQIIENSCTDYANESQYITVNVTVDVNETGTYFLEGELFWKQGYHWHWISWNGREITLDQTGTQTIPINFDASELARAADEGWTGQPLYSNFAVKNSTTWTEIHRIEEYQLQGNYSTDEFTTSPISFNGTITEYPTNASGGSEPYTWLNISTPLNISESGTYEIGAALFDPVNNTIITQTTTTVTSETTVNLSFNGTKISKKQYNGSFEFKAKVFDNETKKAYDSIVASTNHYDYTDFVQAEPEATLEQNFSSHINSDGDLVINVTVNVTSNSTFEIYGELFHNQSETYLTYNLTNQTLNKSSETVPLIFNGSAIHNSSLDGPYVLEFLRLSVLYDNDLEELEVMKDAHVTSGYSCDDFGGA